MKLKPINWFRLRLGGKPWWFRLSHDSISSNLVADDGSHLYGVCLFEERLVEVNVRYPKYTFFETVVHECDHIIFNAVEIGFFEEELVSKTEVLRSNLLAELGLQLPELPDGYTALVEATSKKKRKR